MVSPGGQHFRGPNCNCCAVARARACMGWYPWDCALCLHSFTETLHPFWTSKNRGNLRKDREHKYLYYMVISHDIPSCKKFKGISRNGSKTSWFPATAFLFQFIWYPHKVTQELNNSYQIIWYGELTDTMGKSRNEHLANKNKRICRQKMVVCRAKNGPSYHQQTWRWFSTIIAVSGMRT